MKTFKVVHLKDTDLAIQYIISILEFLFDMIFILSMYSRDFLIVVTKCYEMPNLGSLVLFLLDSRVL